MIKPICRDVMFLSRRAEPATKADLGTARDLLDTLRANSDRCVGMAANMIGVNKSIIAVSIGPMQLVMLNPVISTRSGQYEAEEGCLSLVGLRKAQRYEHIEVEYQDMTMKRRRQSFDGWTAQIIQHEIDHLSGIII